MAIKINSTVDDDPFETVHVRMFHIVNYHKLLHDITTKLVGGKLNHLQKL